MYSLCERREPEVPATPFPHAFVRGVLLLLLREICELNPKIKTCKGAFSRSFRSKVSLQTLIPDKSSTLSLNPKKPL